MKSFVVAAVAAVFMAAPAQAQGKFGGNRHHASDQRSEQQQRKSTEQGETTYQSSLEGMPDQKFDPWHGVR